MKHREARRDGRAFFVDYALGRTADKHINQVRRAKALPGAIHAGQSLLRDDPPVPDARRRQAIVAVATIGIPGRFAEVTEQTLAPAPHSFAQADQRIEAVHKGTVYPGEHEAIIEIDRATGFVCDQSSDEFYRRNIRGRPIGGVR